MDVDPSNRRHVLEACASAPVPLPPRVKPWAHARAFRSSRAESVCRRDLRSGARQTLVRGTGPLPDPARTSRQKSTGPRALRGAPSLLFQITRDSRRGARRWSRRDRARSPAAHEEVPDHPWSGREHANADEQQGRSNAPWAGDRCGRGSLDPTAFTSKIHASVTTMGKQDCSPAQKFRGAWKLFCHLAGGASGARGQWACRNTYTHSPFSFRR